MRLAQAQLLREIVRRNADTDYGRRYGFNRVRTWDDYRERVPLVAYDDLRGEMERIARGEANVLAAEPVVRLEPTSGTSSGSKLVPYTRSLQRAFRRGLDGWIADLFARWPDLKRGPAYWSVTPLSGGPMRSPGGIPIGFDDDTGYLGGAVGRLMRHALAVPTAVKRLADIDAFRYATLRHLVGCADLRIVSVWNPTFFALLLDDLPRVWDRLVDDVPRPDLRRLGPDPVRLWPRLGLVSAWADAAAEVPVRALAARLPHAVFQPKGLLATEALVTVPLGEGAPVLAVRSHAFEFVPDRDGATDTRLAHDLDHGETYRVVVTTQGGLYRYRLGDRVRVDGFRGEVPRLRFVGRAATVDLVGEKLDEAQVRAALDALGVGFAFLAPLPGHPPGYGLFVETATDEAQALAVRVDDALRANVHYDGARRLGQLGPVRPFVLDESGEAAFLRGCVERGQRLGDVKPTALHRAPDWPERLRGRFA